MTFEDELRDLINRKGEESQSNTPDYILATFLNRCLSAFNIAVFRREAHEGRDKKLGVSMPSDGLLKEKARAVITETTPPFLPTDQVETLPVPEDNNPPGVPWGGGGIIAVRERPYVWGHRSYCEIDLYENWTPCSCGAG